jgi:3D (Asp-Asp-Asp) domain-containing protein
VETPVGTFTYSEVLTVEATAYCPESCYPYDGTTTADGSTPQEYHTIAASSDIPFGTKVYIPYFKNESNGGIFEVEDRGGAIKGDIIDIFFDTYDEAIHFGRRNLTIYILE